jgi:hypothetical protein
MRLAVVEDVCRYTIWLVELVAHAITKQASHQDSFLGGCCRRAIGPATKVMLRTMFHQPIALNEMDCTLCENSSRPKKGASSLKNEIFD